MNEGTLVQAATGIATSERQQIMEERLRARIEGKSQDIQTAMQKIEHDGAMLNDYLISPDAMKFVNTGQNINLEGVNGDPFTVHPHAVWQLGDKLGIQPMFLKPEYFGTDWQRDVAVNALNIHAENYNKDRLLIRTVDGQVRGVLSDQYRRLNSMQIFLSYLLAARQHDAVLVDSHAGDTKEYLEIVRPEIEWVETPKNGDVPVAFGSRLRNSNFGDGRLELRTFMMNVVCLNGMVSDSMLSEVHIGSKIPQNIQVSEETMILDTKAKSALVTDIMGSVFTTDNLKHQAEWIREASRRDLDFDKAVKELPRSTFKKKDTELLTKILMENDPLNGLEGGNTLWKFAQGLTAMARDSKPERKRELEKVTANYVNQVM